MTFKYTLFKYSDTRPQKLAVEFNIRKQNLFGQVQLKMFLMSQIYLAKREEDKNLNHISLFALTSAGDQLLNVSHLFCIMCPAIQII